MDGIKNEIDPGDPTDQNLYALDEAALAKITHAPETLSEALTALEDDHAFLTADGVFSEQFVGDFIGMKRTEAAEINTRPTAGEFAQYYDV